MSDLRHPSVKGVKIKVNQVNLTAHTVQDPVTNVIKKNAAVDMTGKNLARCFQNMDSGM